MVFQSQERENEKNDCKLAQDKVKKYKVLIREKKRDGKNTGREWDARFLRDYCGIGNRKKD